MSDEKKKGTAAPTGELWMWNAPDSGAILGLGLTPETAHADAKARRGGSGEGYATRCRLDHFPVGRNPVLVLMHARELFMMEAAATPVAVPAEPAEDVEAAKKTKPKNGAVNKADA